MGRGRAIEKAALWLAVDAVGSSAISVSGMLIAAAIIGPEAVGLASIVLVITQLLNFFVETLFADAIVQRKRLRSAHLDSAFWFLGLLGCVMGAAAAVGGHWAASIYGHAEVETMLLVSSVAILASGVSSVQAALMRRLLLFRPLTIVNITGRSLGSVAAVVIALGGQGAWSLIAQYIIGTIAFSAGAMFAVGWTPGFSIKVRYLRELLSFGLLETLSQFVVAGRIRIFLSLVGTTLPLAAVGQINLAFRLMDSLRGVIAGALGRLCLVVFSRRQSDEPALREAFLEMSEIVGVLTLPGFTALFIVSPEIVTVIFGPKWNGLAVQLQVLSLLAIVYFSRSTVTFLMTAKGMPQVSFLLGFLNLITTIVLFYVVSPNVAEEALLVWAAPILLLTALEVPITRRLLRLSYRDQFRAVSPGLGAAILTGIIVLLTRQLSIQAGLPPILLLVIEGTSAATLAGAFALRHLKRQSLSL